jgi:putative transposase
VDITFRLAYVFAYLVAIMDWYSRLVLALRLSNTLDSGFCIDCLEEAFRTYGAPEIFNTDQGTQFTSTAFTKVLADAKIAISMDGRGRALDNIFVERLWRSFKYEDIYLKGTSSLPSCTKASEGISPFITMSGPIKRWAVLRPHQSIERRRGEVRK